MSARTACRHAHAYCDMPVRGTHAGRHGLIQVPCLPSRDKHSDVHLRKQEFIWKAIGDAKFSLRREYTG